ncbi:hypothetical protein N7509_011131 [Penicillium cosmopolitanum]|uniref:Xylanolytic transcriptional activator regulatory domain-containing protein n=1 Tax=Penicillium cosmopolitanum TaxID=1131564 RepID=A0A9W9VSW3_9EURO|nr:uncharacterized protein N7509_011131 [Penicillium cosmopolitanum]KAJ5388590.1 hypothetical protein N7509_011131 [Penicillium cosmopolitanum]
MSAPTILTPDSGIDSSRRLSGIPPEPQPSIASSAVNSETPILTQTGTVELAHCMPFPTNDVAASDTRTVSEFGTWFLEEDFDVGALDFSLTSTISEWAQIPNVFPTNELAVREQGIYTPLQSSAPDVDSAIPNDETVRRKWFTRMSPPREHHSSRDFPASGPTLTSHTNTNESYRAGLSQKLRPRIQDEALPTSEQLNLFAKLYFHRFHPLLPVIHTPSFRPTAENALLFLSICSIGSLFVGSSRALAQGARIFERLNKAILASWESFISRSHPDAFSMVQAAILGQTYAILAGEPKYLVLADVLHGTVVAWAREANRLGDLRHCTGDFLDENDMDSSWHRWIECEQRAQVQVALHIHDAELATLLHHQPIRNHRFRQFPQLASDALFSAPTASEWATLYRQSLQSQPSDPVYPRSQRSLDSFPITGRHSRFTAYGLLESINARLVDAKQSDEFDHLVCQEISDLLIKWWKTYYTETQDLFCLPVLWHSIFISLYADLDLLEQSIGRDGHHPAFEASTPVREWASSLNASRCLIHASLITHYLERMSISSEPAIHVPRALFSAALTYLCVANHAPKHIICAQAFASPEIELLGENASQAHCFPEYTHTSEGSIIADFDHLYRLIDLLQRGGRWGISRAFAGVISAALEEKGRTSLG